MIILSLNCGSSSVKGALIGNEADRLAEVQVENIGGADCRLVVEGRSPESLGGASYEACVGRVLEEMIGRSRAQGGIAAVAHRIVHGGDQFVKPTLVTDAVLASIEALSVLAPLHNPPAVAALHAARKALPELAHVAVFDTAFHATLPPCAREYALPTSVRERFQIRRYGFHGISHEHAMQAIAAQLRRPCQELRIVSCHLGNGASVAAIECGRSVETSMGMTPLEGLVMGTRAGDVDSGVLLQLLHSGEYDAAGLDALLNRESGLKGLTGTNDLREIERRAGDGDEPCRRAIAVYAHRVRKYIGAYAAVMGGVDAIAFTGGIGEHSALMRNRILQRLDFLGARLDDDRNRDVDQAASISRVSDDNSRVLLFVVKADEEAAMARATAQFLGAPP